MTSDRDAIVERICQAALERDPAERATFLDEACSQDSARRREIEALLA